VFVSLSYEVIQIGETFFGQWTVVRRVGEYADIGSSLNEFEFTYPPWIYTFTGNNFCLVGMKGARQC
jgi:hypothetical protein